MFANHKIARQLQEGDVLASGEVVVTTLVRQDPMWPARKIVNMLLEKSGKTRQVKYNANSTIFLQKQG